MRPRRWMAGLLWTVLLAGCNLPANEPGTPTPGIIPIAAVSPVPTLQPVLPTITSEPPPVYATAGEQPVNCRFGPGLIYEVISMLDAGSSARVAGKDYTERWLYVKDPLNPGGFCWAARSAVELEGALAPLPIQGPPAVTVDKVAVHVEPARVTVTCDKFPQFVLLVGEITTNGPAAVNWRWEISTGEVSQAEILAFEEADTKTVQRSFIIYSANDYWVRVHVNSPNEIADQATFVANCTP